MAQGDDLIVLVVTRFSIAPDDDGFAARARAALAALAARPGYGGGRIARAVDDPASWLLTTEWDDIGSYRRSLGNFEVKMVATPLLAQAIGEPSAYEVLYDDVPGRAARIKVSDRALDAARARVGDRRTPAGGATADGALAPGRESD